MQIVSHAIPSWNKIYIEAQIINWTHDCEAIGGVYAANRKALFNWCNSAPEVTTITITRAAAAAAADAITIIDVGWYCGWTAQHDKQTGKNENLSSLWQFTQKSESKKKLSGAGEILRAKKIACKLFGKVSQFIWNVWYTWNIKYV